MPTTKLATKPFSWTVRFDIAPTWVADGFTLSDTRALEMLATAVDHACMDTELAARVIAAPPALRLAREMGYGPTAPLAGAALREILSDCPHAYATGKPARVNLDQALVEAIQLLDSVAFVRDEGDNTQQVLGKLKEALGLVRGETPISRIKWEATPA